MGNRIVRNASHHPADLNLNVPNLSSCLGDAMPRRHHLALSHRAAKRCPLGNRPVMLEPVIPGKQLGDDTVLVGHGEVMPIEGPKSVIANLHEAVTKAYASRRSNRTSPDIPPSVMMPCSNVCSRHQPPIMIPELYDIEVPMSQDHGVVALPFVRAKPKITDLNKAISELQTPGIGMVKFSRLLPPSVVRTACVSSRQSRTGLRKHAGST